MIVFRVGKTKYARDLDGEGARLNGGRWNHKLVACIYTSESRALSILEYTVNVNIDDIPRALSITSFEIADSGIMELSEADLPGNWKGIPLTSSTKDMGSLLLRKAETAVVKIPSAVVPEEYNYLLNPAHLDSKHFRILNVSDFIYDIRIKLV